MSEASEQYDPKAKYALLYAQDLSIPRGADPANTKLVTFRWIGGFLWFLARNKQARAASLANRAQFLTIDRKKK